MFRHYIRRLTACGGARGWEEQDRTTRANRFLEIFILCLILALAVYLRFSNLATNPGWYTDEGTHLDIARNLLRGRVQYLAVRQSTLLFAKLPLFELLLAALLEIAGGGLATLRALTGGLGVLSVGLLYGVVRRTQRSSDPALALLAALMLAIYPQAIVYSRFGFSYNLLAPLLLLAALGCWEYLGAPAGAPPARRRWLALAALAVGLGSVSDLWAFALLPPLVVVAWKRDWRDVLWGLPLACLPFGLYAAAMLIHAPEPFLFDLRFTLFRLGRLSLVDQLRMLAVNYATLTLQDAWIGLGLVGLFLLRPARLRRLSLLLFLFPIVILGRTAALYSLGFYYTIPLLPLVGLGIAALLRRGMPFALQVLRGALPGRFSGRFHGRGARIGLGLTALLVMAMPFATSLVLTAQQVRDGFKTRIDPFLVDPDHARRAAEFVNARAVPADVVIASPSLGWLIEAHAADVQMATVAAGYPAPDLPADLPAERFAFDPCYGRARFVIVDNLWHNWAVWNVPGASHVLREVETWRLVFQAGEVVVYENPEYR